MFWVTPPNSKIFINFQHSLLTSANNGVITIIEQGNREETIKLPLMNTFKFPIEGGMTYVDAQYFW